MWPTKINENTVDQKKYIETHKVALQYHIQLIEHINSFKTKKISIYNHINRLPECDSTVNHNFIHYIKTIYH